jgi:hypothetical protein
VIRFGAVLTVVIVAMGLLAGGVLTNSLLLVYLAIGVAALSAVMLAVGLVIWRGDIFGEASARRAAAPEALATGTPGMAGMAPAPAGAAPGPAARMPVGGTAGPVALGQSTVLMAGGNATLGRGDPPAPPPPIPPWGSQDLPEPPDLRQPERRPEPPDLRQPDDLRRPRRRPEPQRPPEPEPQRPPEPEPQRPPEPERPSQPGDLLRERRPRPERRAERPAPERSVPDRPVPDRPAGERAPVEPAAKAEPEAEVAPQAEAAPGTAAKAAPPAEPEADVNAEAPAEAEQQPHDDAEPAAGAGGTPGPATQVTIVPGIARYHRSGCILIRFLGPEDLETMTMQAAEEAGCVPCKACRPEQDLAGE